MTYVGPSVGVVNAPRGAAPVFVIFELSRGLAFQTALLDTCGIMEVFSPLRRS